MKAIRELDSPYEEQRVTTSEETSATTERRTEHTPAMPAPPPVEELHEQIGSTVGDVTCADAFMSAENVNVFYGDNHAIRDVNLEIGRGQVVASVQGSRPEPYKVMIRVTQLSPDDWQKMGSALTARTSFLARLTAGEMPATTHQPALRVFL